MFENILSAITKGVVAAGKGVKQGVGAVGRRIEELEDYDDGSDMMRTPPLVPPGRTGNKDNHNFSMPITTQTSTPVAEPPARPSAPIAPPPWKPAMDLPISRGDMMAPPPPSELPITRGNMAVTPRTPTMNELRYGLPAPALRNALSAVSAGPMTKPPGSMTAAPAVEPPKDYRGRTIDDSTNFARDQYVRSGGESDQRGNFKVRRSLMDALVNAGLGFMTGAAKDGLGGGVGGAIAASAGTAIDPLRAREFRFDTMERPRLEAETERGRTARRQRIEEAIQQGKVDAIPREAEMDRAQIERIKAETDAARTPKRQSPAWHQVMGPNGQPVMVDLNAPENQGKVFKPYIKPTERQPTSAELQIDPETGLSVEEQADASYQKRGGDEYVRSKLPARTRQILEAGTITSNGKERRATQAEINAAQGEFERAIGRQRKTDLEYTRGAIRGKRVRNSQNKEASSGSQPTAQRKAVVGQDFIKHVAGALNITPEEARRRIEADGYAIK